MQNTAIHRIIHLPLKLELDEPPTLVETIEAIAHLQCRKAAGVDGNLPEIWMFIYSMLYVNPHNLLAYY